MGITFSADEVFEMAERIEENGAAFYRRAAGLQGGEAEVFLQGLAIMEDEHRATFSEMRSDLTSREREMTAADPYLEAQLFLNQMANQHGGEGSPAAIEALSADDSLADLLRTAISLEQKSITFYVGLRDLVPLRLGRDGIDDIIAEEKAHVATLATKLKSLAD